MSGSRNWFRAAALCTKQTKPRDQNTAARARRSFVSACEPARYVTDAVERLGSRLPMRGLTASAVGVFVRAAAARSPLLGLRTRPKRIRSEMGEDVG
jgi:hypothetical protein